MLDLLSCLRAPHTAQNTSSHRISLISVPHERDILVSPDTAACKCRLLYLHDSTRVYCINSHYQFAHSTALPASPPGICEFRLSSRSPSEFRLSSRSPSRRATERRLNGHGRTGGAFPVRTPVPCSSTIPHHGPPLLSPTNLRAPSSHQSRTNLAAHALAAALLAVGVKRGGA